MQMELEHHVLKRDGLSWHVVTAGPADAPPVLLLHCWSGNWTEWQQTLERLSTRFRCIVPDHLGFGQSDKPLGDHYRIAAQAVRARFILQHFGYEQAHVMGHSMGGQIALTLAANYPAAVRRLVVVDPPVTGRMHWLAYPLTVYPKLARVGIEFPYWWMQRMFKLVPSVMLLTMYIFFAKPMQHREASLYWAKQMGADGQIRSSSWAFKAIREWDLRPILAKIAAPTLAIWGAKDWLVPLAECSLLEQGIAGCRAVRIPGVGHFPMIENFDAYLREVEGFLAEQ